MGSNAPAKTAVRAPRDSNIELMRIVLMYLIIAHHMVVNSGVALLWSAADIGPSGVLLTLWGMWGKTAINAFVMVTGWFLSTSDFSWKRLVRLVGQVYFWKLVIWVPLLAIAAPHTGTMDLLLSFVSPLRGANSSFTPSFLAMYLFVPSMNCAVREFQRKDLLALLAALLAVNTLAPTLLASRTAFAEVPWYCTLYLIAAYLRAYRPTWSEDRRTVSVAFACSIALAVASVCALMLLDGMRGLGSFDVYFMVSDSGKLLALTTGVLCFLWFKLLPVPPSRLVNTLASASFGVLCIHAHSDAMRAVLWGRIVDICRLYQECTTLQLAAWCVVIPVVVYLICATLDLLRQRLVEPSFMGWIDMHEQGIERRAAGVWDALVGHM